MHLMTRYGARCAPLARSSMREAIERLGTSRACSSAAHSQGTRSASAASTPPSPPPPPIVQYLGYGGAVPFISGALASTLASDPVWFARATQMYGCSILSFVGAVHWGVALRAVSGGSTASCTDWMYGVTPSLVACGAALMTPADGLALLSGAFCAAYGYDFVRFRAAAGAPAWYLRVRGPLSIAAVGACGVSYLAMRRKLETESLEDAISHAQQHSL